MKKIGILIKMEMTEILRDKKTLIIMILMPLLLYPTLIIGIVLGTSMIMQSQAEEEYIVGYLEGDEAYMEPFLTLYEQEQEELETKLLFQKAAEGEEASAKEEADVWVSFSKEAQTIQVRVDYTSTDQNSNYAEYAMEELTDLYRDGLLAKNLEKEGLTEDFLYPVTYEAIDSVSTTESIGMNMGGMMGMLLITMILLGAFYPAVDVTTGEKERGTLETLLTLPVTNFEMIMSKFISVSIFACVTAILSLIALGGSVLFLMFAMPLEDMVQLPVKAFASGMPVLILALITTALLITAFCMCFCVFAKSSKEANNYMTPIMLVIMFASMVGMFPTVELDYKFALIPFVNVSLLIKQVFAQQWNLSLALVTVLVNFAYSIITIWVLAKMYNSEDIMFSDGFRSFRLFQKREDIKQGTIPATGDIIISLVVLLLAMIYVGGIVSARDQFIGTVVTQMMIAAVPLALTWYMKSDRKKLFNLQKPKKEMLLGSILLYIGTYFVMFVLGSVLMQVFPDSTQGLEMAFDEMINHHVIAVTLVIAVMPAIGEELLFRGLVFGSLRNRYKIGWAILITGFLFGAFHTSIVKLIPTGMLGACFAYVVYKSGSIFVSMALHFVNNFVSVLAMKYPVTIEKFLPFLTQEEFTTAELLVITVVGIAFTVAGFMFMNRKTKSEKTE